jgi:hypothetical protein
MRITLDIDEDVLLAAKELAKPEQQTPGKIINALARKALAGGKSSRSQVREGVPLLRARAARSSPWKRCVEL